MTEYTEHADALFGVDEPILASTAMEARDNLKSVTEGDQTAPRVSGLGMLPETASADWSSGGDVAAMVSLDLGAARAAIIMCYVNGDLNENDETGGVTIKLQGSVDNSAWTNLETVISYSSSSQGLEAKVSISYPYVGTGGTAYRYYRLNLETGGNNTGGNACLMCIGSAGN